MLIHSPQPWAEFGGDDRYFEGNLEAWRALEEAFRAGKVRAISVSNFQQADLDNILNNAAVKPAVNQVLAHVGNTPFDLIAYTEGKGILVEAYSPIGHGEILDNPDLKAMARRYRVTLPQLCIRYLSATRSIATAQDREPAAHARQRRRGFRDFRGGYADAENG